MLTQAVVGLLGAFVAVSVGESQATPIGWVHSRIRNRVSEPYCGLTGLDQREPAVFVMRKLSMK
jgi:hypothetical protein